MDGRNEMEQLQKMFDLLGPPNVDEWPGLTELPILKQGQIELPKRWHLQNNGKHLLDIFRNWDCPSGIKLLMSLLKYNPGMRLTAKEALSADYFSTLVRGHVLCSLFAHIYTTTCQLTFLLCLISLHQHR